MAIFNQLDCVILTMLKFVSDIGSQNRIVLMNYQCLWNLTSIGSRLQCNIDSKSLQQDVFSTHLSHLTLW